MAIKIKRDSGFHLDGLGRTVPGQRPTGVMRQLASEFMYNPIQMVGLIYRTSYCQESRSVYGHYYNWAATEALDACHYCRDSQSIGWRSAYPPLTEWLTASWREANPADAQKSDVDVAVRLLRLTTVIEEVRGDIDAHIEEENNAQENQ